MGIFSKKLERVFPVVKRDYHVCQNGFVQHLVMLKNSYIRDWNNFPIPYVEAVEKYLSTYKGNIHKRILFVTENDMVAVKSALLMKEIYENKYCNTPSLSQAQRLKKFSQEGRLSIDVMRAIMSEEKKSDLDRVTLSSEKLSKYFPKSWTPAQMENQIIKLLESWHKRRQQMQER